MHPMVEEKLAALLDLCTQYRVLRLDLYGSATGKDFDPRTSDLDFLVELEDRPPADYSEAYFGLKEALERLFGRPVDLVVESAVTNPYFRESVERTRIPVYAA